MSYTGEDQKLHDLVGDIYDTTLNHESWTGVVGKIAGFAGAQCGGLVSKDPKSKLAVSPYNYGVDPHYVQLYEETYSKFDPLVIFPPFGQVASVPDLVTYDDYRQGPFTQEWLWPQGLVDVGWAVLDRPGPNCSVILALLRSRSRGMMDEETRLRIALIVPHARRALLIGKSMDLKQSEAATFADTLNGLSTSIFFIDAIGRIVHANAAGHDMLYAGDPLHSVEGRLATRDSRANQNLRDVLAGCANGEIEIGGKAIALPLTAHDGERFVAHVLPLTSGERRATGIAYTAVAAVFMRRAELGSPLDLIAKTYNLTPAEVRVLLAIVDVGGVPETAAALGVAETTVKTHLYRLFDKASVSRQADLVKIVAGFSNPLVS